MDGRAEAPPFCDGPPRRRCDDDILHLTWRIRVENLARNRLDTSCSGRDQSTLLERFPSAIRW